jgi:metallo-beta-lactamase family protein
VQALAKPPKEVFVVHGEPEAADTFRLRLEEQLGVKARVPDYRQVVELVKTRKTRPRSS